MNHPSVDNIARHLAPFKADPPSLSTPAKRCKTMQDDDLIRAQAMIQSLERLCTESRTREVHKDAAIAVLQSQWQKATKELADLKAKYEPKTAATQDPQEPAAPANKGANRHARRAAKNQQKSAPKAEPGTEPATGKVNGAATTEAPAR